MVALDIGLICIFSLGLAMGLTRVMIRLQIMDMPSERSSHAAPTPRAGGVAIMLTTLFATFLLYLLYPHILERLPAFFIILGAALGMGIMGLMDDISPLPFQLRLGLQVSAAVVCILAGVSFSKLNIPFFGTVNLGIFAPLFTIFWVVGFTNAFNFWDGLNGLASGTALLGVAALIWLSQSSTNPFLLGFYGILLMAIAGFFMFNFPRARIFLGDSGSQFLGFLLAELGIFVKEPSQGHLSMYTVPLLFLPILFDISLTLIRRWQHQESLIKPHREYLFHLLNRVGWSHTQVSLSQFGIIGCHIIGAIILQKTPTPYQWVIFLPFLVAHSLYARAVLQLAHRHKILAKRYKNRPQNDDKQTRQNQRYQRHR